jgi:O-acetyl-ADP-ribose deacetylase (regulator of RNase III)
MILSSFENKTSMQFLYGDRELWMGVNNLLIAEVDVIVNPANSDLSHDGGLAAQILTAAGKKLADQSMQLIQEYESIESGMAVYTSAGHLPYKAVIHAVGPIMGEGDEQHKIEQAVSRSLLLCEANDWHSIAFPAISTGFFNVPIETCAQAFFRAITHFWDARQESAVEKILICLTNENFRTFFDAFREDAITEPTELTTSNTDEEAVGHVVLNEEDLADIDDEIAEWFK